MNFPGKLEQGSSLSHFSMHADLGSFSLDGHANTVTMPNGHLLFSGDYERSGLDLIVSDHDHRVVIHDYFRGEQRPTLVSPEGAPLDPKVIEALTGHDAYAQAAGTAPAAKVVGHVVKMTGSASIVRNGVTIDANNGDTVYQSDVVQTGSGSTLGLVLIDGTTFNLTANARMMLNDLTYDGASTPNTSLLTLVAASASNTSLFTLVQGAASFVAGQVAKTGDMKVATPVAVIGIRGTAVILDISSTDGKVSISVVNQQDGQTHDVQVFKCIPVVAGQPGVCTSGDLIGTVTSNGPALTVTPAANFQVVVQESNKTTAQVAQEFSTFQQVLTTYDLGKQLAPNTPPPSDGKRGDANPQSTTKFAGSSTPPIESTSAQLITTASVQHLDANTETTIVVTGSSSVSVTPTQSLSLLQVPIALPPTTVAITSPAAVGNIINQSEVAAGFTISGTATAGSMPVNGQTATITIVDSSNVVKYTYTTIVANGAWSVNVPAAQAQALADGTYSIKATVSDTTGNTATTATQTITVDTVPPSVAITSSGGPTNQATQTITGTVDVADAGATVTILDGTTAVGSAIVQGNGSWSSSVTLNSGSNSLTAKVSDLAGNPATSSAVIYTLSTTGPTLTENLAFDTGSSATDHITANDALSGTGLANTVVHFTLDGSPVATTVTANAQGAWSFTPSGLADGPHTIVASQTDTFGNTGTASLSFTLDTTAPVVAITSPGGPTNQATQTITGTADVADAGATVTILDGTTAVGSAIVQGNGSWSSSVTLNSGSNSLTAKVSDLAGNTATSSAVIYTLSTTGPTVTENLAFDTGSSATDHISSNDALSGTGLANTVVHFTIDGSPVATTVTATAQGAWSFTPSGLADGPHTIVASQTDTFGNTGTATLGFTLDTTAPVVAITGSGGPTNQAAQTISGTGEAGTTDRKS